MPSLEIVERFNECEAPMRIEMAGGDPSWLVVHDELPAERPEAWLHAWRTFVDYAVPAERSARRRPRAVWDDISLMLDEQTGDMSFIPSNRSGEEYAYSASVIVTWTALESSWNHDSDFYETHLVTPLVNALREAVAPELSDMTLSVYRGTKLLRRFQLTESGAFTIDVDERLNRENS